MPTAPIASEMPPPPELRADAARNRALVLGVAREQLDAGDTTLAMNVLAREAGVGVGTVYRHFPSRQVLLEQLAMPSLAHLVRVTQKAADAEDPAVGLAHLMRSALRSLQQDVALVQVLAGGAASCVQTTEMQVDLESALGRLLDRARAAGAIRPDIGPDDLRRYLSGFEVALRLGDQSSVQADRDLAVLLAGLRPSAWPPT